MSEPQQIINIGAVANDGTGESLRDAFNAVNNNFANIWAAGPVDSQVIITNNRISTTEINLDLILAGNGTGNVTVASTLVPSIDSVYELGSPSRYFDTTYSRYFYGNGRFLTGISGGGGGGGGNITFSVGPPANASIGDVWIESDTGVQYLYFNDNTSNQWAEMEAYQSFSAGYSNGGSGNVNFTAITSDLISTPGNAYSIGNMAQPWQNIWLANTLWLGNNAVVMNGNTLTVNGNQVLTGNSNPRYSSISVTGNVKTNAIYTNNYFYANGAPFPQGNGIAGSTISIYGNVIETTVTNQNLTLNPNGIGVIQANASYVPSIDSVYDVGSSTNRINSVYAQYFYGNGSQLTGLPTGYSNSQVSNYLASGTDTANIITTANVSGNYILGNGSQLTGLVHNTGNIGFVGDAMYDLNGVIIENADLSHGATAAVILPSNGNATNPLQVTNTYGNILLTTGTDPGHLQAWVFGKDGTLTTPTGGNIAGANVISATTFSAAGNVFVDGFMSVVGNLYVSNVVTTGNLVVYDPLVYFVANTAYPYDYDIGFYSHFVGGTGNTYQHSGFVRDYTDNTWKLFSNVTPEPTNSTVNLTNAIYDPIKVGNLTSVGNVSATYFTGNGSQLTGIVSSYGNSNVVANLAALGSNPVSTTGNITGGNITTAGQLVSTVATGTAPFVISSTTKVAGLNVEQVDGFDASQTATANTIVVRDASGNINTVVLSASGNIISGNISTAGLVSAVGNLYTSNAVTYSDTSNILGWWWSNSVSISAQELTSTDVQFNSTGNTMYVVGTTGRAVYQYSLTSPWQVATATYSSLSANVSAQAASPQSINFNSNGNTMFVLDQTSRAVYQYSISNIANVATATYASLSANISAQETTTPTGMTFSPDGANMYIVGTTLDTIYQYTISNTANIATATYASKSLNISSQDGTATGLAFNATGNVLYLLGASNKYIIQYNLTVPYDISTGTAVTNVNSSYVGYQDSSPQGIYVNLANNAVYITGQTNDRVYQYDTGNSTIVASNSLAVTGYAHFSGNIQAGNITTTTGSTISATGTVTVNSTLTGAAGITFSTTTSAINIGTSQTTGAFQIGGLAQTSNIGIGRSTANQAIVIGNGVTASGSIKTIDIGTLGAANSTTNINIGPTAGNAQIAFLSNAQVSIANTGGLALSVVGNVTGGNISTAGLITATGNITGGNIKATTTTQLAVYANATVRDSTITSPQPGMMIYVTGTGMQVRGATSWNTIAGSGT